jgi:hypothetical protein
MSLVGYATQVTGVSFHILSLDSCASFFTVTDDCQTAVFTIFTPVEVQHVKGYDNISLRCGH